MFDGIPLPDFGQNQVKIAHPTLCDSHAKRQLPAEDKLRRCFDVRSRCPEQTGHRCDGHRQLRRRLRRRGLLSPTKHGEVLRRYFALWRCAATL